MKEFLDRGQFKNNGPACVPVKIWSYLEVKPRADHLADISDPASSLAVREKVDFLAIFEVITNCLVAADELHVSVLTFSGVEENPVVSPAVGIAVLFALVAGENEDEILVGGRADATLRLAAVLVVEVAAATTVPPNDRATAGRAPAAARCLQAQRKEAEIEKQRSAVLVCHLKGVERLAV